MLSEPQLAPSNGDFPPSSVRAQSEVNSRDMRALLTAVYGTVAGTLATYNTDTPGHMQVKYIFPC